MTQKQTITGIAKSEHAREGKKTISTYSKSNRNKQQSDVLSNY